MLKKKRSPWPLGSEKTWKPTSLDLVELIMEFEERFGGEISDEDAQKITTVGEAVEYVKTRM